MDTTGKVALVATTDIGARTFYEGFAKSFREAGIAAILICPSTERSNKFASEENLELHALPFVRKPRPHTDMVQLFRLVQLFRSEAPGIIVTGSPKASLLVTIAARLLGITSIYTVHGLRYQGASGVKKAVLKISEKLTCALAVKVVCVGFEIQEQLHRDSVVPRRKSTVLGAGSANGVLEPALSQVEASRRGVGEARDVLSVGFVGRITEDKGFRVLIKAWNALSPALGEVELIVAGDLETDLADDEDTLCFLGREDVTYVGYQSDLSEVYKLMDVLVLPSFREGLPTVVLEAAVNSVPSIVSNSTGTSEPVVDAVTGYVIEARSVVSLVNAIERAASDRQELVAMGQNAKSYVLKNYCRERVHENWVSYVRQMI